MQEVQNLGNSLAFRKKFGVQNKVWRSEERFGVQKKVWRSGKFGVQKKIGVQWLRGTTALSSNYMCVVSFVCKDCCMIVLSCIMRTACHVCLALASSRKWLVRVASHLEQIYCTCCVAFPTNLLHMLLHVYFTCFCKLFAQFVSQTRWSQSNKKQTKHIYIYIYTYRYSCLYAPPSLIDLSLHLGRTANH